MKARLRSPSLFLTFAGAFLGVLVVGAVLQGVVVVHIVGAVREHFERDSADALAEQVAREIEETLTATPQAEVSRVLDGYPTRPDSFLLAYRNVEGTIVLPTRLRRRMAFAVRRLLSTNADLELGPLRPPLAEARDAFRDPPPSPPPGGRGRRAPLRLVAVQPVQTDGATRGHVLAIRHGPPPHALAPLARDRSALLLFLPLALVLAGGAGLWMFRSVLGRLRVLEQLTTRVAAGDLEVRVADPGADEIGRLGAALNRMTGSLARAQRALDDTHRERRRLFADISHELATPLTSIRGYTETLLDGDVRVSSDERETYLQHIRDASTRMALLLDDLLELTRLESGAIQLTRERLDWTALCVHTLERFEPRFRAAGLQLEWEGAREVAWIRADGRRMEQVVDNLLVNALRYVPAGGRVTLGLAAGATRHCMVVADDGPGFAPDDVAHVFDRFFRGRGQAQADGSGLGLAIVKEIVRGHGGEVRARNAAQRGAVIEVELPADRA